MTAAPTSGALPVQAFESLARLQQLSLEAGLSVSFQQLVFRILNRPVVLCRYDRAVLWDLRGGRARLLGVSGSIQIDRRSPLVSEWRSLVEANAHRNRPGIIGSDDLPGHRDTWDALAERTQGLSVAWLPIMVGGRVVAGWWLERWGDDRFTNEEVTRLESLALAYGVAWRSVTGGQRRWTNRLPTPRRPAALVAGALFVAAMCLVRLPLRVVAHCEVVPRHPVAVSAPLDGVIDEVLILPGRQVAKGELLAVYDKRVASEELKIARQQVQIIESDLQRSRAQAFDDPSARAATALLENRLAQERIRLQVAEYRASRLEIVAPVAGTLMLDDPHQWRGRPVQVGERIMMIVDPAQTRLRVWLPDSDNIAFDENRPVKVILDSDPGSAQLAKLRFVANHSQIDDKSMPSFRAEADWLDMNASVKTGLQGTAVLYGGRVTLAYWLLRRPLASLRRGLGI